MPAALKAVFLVIGAYIVGLGLGLAVPVLVTIALQPKGCSDFSRALVVVWVMLGVVAFVNIGLAGLVAWRLRIGLLGSAIALAIHGVALAATYVAIAFATLVGFNC